MIHFPTSSPDASPVDLWRVQNEILAVAESLLGPRDCSKHICQPVFKDDGPYLINTKDGACAALSNNAAGYWPTAVYELAHETVHLLNPVEGTTNWLEEGVAVAFSVHVSNTMTPHKMAPADGSSYDKALKLVHHLAEPCFDAATRIRQKSGSLSGATEETLHTLFPTVEEDVIQRLVTNCTPR